jgi:quercetin dioxygenase-like cupin family protein
MRTTRLAYLAAILAFAACSKASGTTVQDTPTAPSASKSNQQGITWGPAPAFLPPGAQIAVLEGDPTAAGTFTIRLKLPNGYKIPPHTHPTVENVTVLSGTFRAGMGTAFDDAKLTDLGRDAFVSIPAEHAHYAMARGETVVQVHGLSPFVLTYVNPADATR